MNELISIIIPTYNQGEFLERCLKSISSQSYKNFEIIVIDNASTDNTKSIVDKFNYLPLKYLVNKNKGMIAQSRNLGIQKASGDIIAFLDSDDYWENDKLHLCYEKIRQGYDFVFHDLKISGNNISIFQKKLKGRVLKKPYYKDLIVNGNTISNSSVLIKKKFLIKINLINESKKMKASEDYNTWIKILRETDNFFYINECLGFYQYNLEGVSRKNMSYCTFNAIKEFVHLLDNKEKNHTMSRIFYMSAKYFFENKKYNYCYNKFKISFKHGKMKIKCKSIYYLLILLFKN